MLPPFSSNSQEFAAWFLVFTSMFASASSVAWAKQRLEKEDAKLQIPDLSDRTKVMEETEKEAEMWINHLNGYFGYFLLLAAVSASQTQYPAPYCFASILLAIGGSVHAFPVFPRHIRAYTRAKNLSANEKKFRSLLIKVFITDPLRKNPVYICGWVAVISLMLINAYNAELNTLLHLAASLIWKGTP